MTYDYSTGEVPLTQYTSDWLPNPFYFSPGGVYELLTRAKDQERGVQGSPHTPGGRTDGPPIVYSDQGTIRAHPELVLARLLERERELTDIRDSLRVCEEGIAQLLSERQAEHISHTEPSLSDIREGRYELDPEYSEPIQPGRTSGADKHSTHWGAACYGDGWAYNPRSKGGNR